MALAWIDSLCSLEGRRPEEESLAAGIQATYPMGHSVCPDPFYLYIQMQPETGASPAYWVTAGNV